MRRLLIVIALTFISQTAPPGQSTQPISDLLKTHQYDLATEGTALLRKEARAASFFAIVCYREVTPVGR